jgi:hypothetical protein
MELRVAMASAVVITAPVTVPAVVGAFCFMIKVYVSSLRMSRANWPLLSVSGLRIMQLYAIQETASGVSRIPRKDRKKGRIEGRISPRCKDDA